MSKTRPGQAIPGASSVDDFAAQAQKNGFDVLGTKKDMHSILHLFCSLVNFAD
jgi:hypothetical protein